MKRVLHGALTFGTFPIVFAGVMGVGVYGVEEGWNPVATVMGLTGAVVLLLLVLERVHPFQDAWLHSHGDIRTDIIHNFVNFWIPEVYAVSFVGVSPWRRLGCRTRSAWGFGRLVGRCSPSCCSR